MKTRVYKDGRWRGELYSQLGVGDKVFMQVEYDKGDIRPCELTVNTIKIDKDGIKYISSGDIHGPNGEKYHHHKEFTSDDLGHTIFFIKPSATYH